MAVEVLARILVHGITVGRNTNFGAVEPPLRKAAGRYLQAADSTCGQCKAKEVNVN